MGLPHQWEWKFPHSGGKMMWGRRKEPIHRLLIANEQNCRDRQASLTFKNTVKISDDIYVTVNTRKAQWTILKQNKNKTG